MFLGLVDTLGVTCRRKSYAEMEAATSLSLGYN